MLAVDKGFDGRLKVFVRRGEEWVRRVEVFRGVEGFRRVVNVFLRRVEGFLRGVAIFVHPIVLHVPASLRRRRAGDRIPNHELGLEEQLLHGKALAL